MTNHHELRVLALIGDALHSWGERQRHRRELARMTERELHDIGLSWSEAAYEVDKPFWRA
ncbi:DUF1127 domain-containing protein [Rhodopseudomonas sp.]|uniref:DUF1127 domain-containing protein n=1 Tax=Rhodopseudomonas sp. TaxID=1078 RepID=UPI0039C8D067